MTDKRIIIAGSRSFTDYNMLKTEVDKYLEYNTNKEDTIIIVSGTARGADQLGERYAREKGYRLERYPANWDLYGRSAGYRRNEQMGKIADLAILFWDGSSRGTVHMRDIMVKLGKDYNVIRFEAQ